MSSEEAISVQNISKCYLVYKNPQDRLKQYLYPRLQKLCGINERKYYKEFWALRNINLTVNRGETVGIIGRNGSGKSTLLQIICGTLHPTTGTVSTKGRVAALLELGSGFNPEFTGRENIFMNAAILGMHEDETREKFEQIVNFADIGDHLEQPVKTYSSGMVVRLAFAVQAMSSPRVLIVDEALAVGDVKFQAKCFERLKQLKANGTSILLVTHSSEQIVTHCDRAILIHNGMVASSGLPRNIINQYLDSLFGREAFSVQSAEESKKLNHSGSNSTEIHASLKHLLDFNGDKFSTHPGYNASEYRWGDGQAKIIDFHLTANNQNYPTLIGSGDSVNLYLAVRFISLIIRPIIGVTIKTHEGVTVYGTNSEKQRIDTSEWGEPNSTGALGVAFPCNLAPGHYLISIGIASRDNDDVVPHDRRYDAIHFEIRPDPLFFGLANLQMSLKLVKDIQ